MSDDDRKTGPGILWIFPILIAIYIVVHYVSLWMLGESANATFGPAPGRSVGTP